MEQTNTIQHRIVKITPITKKKAKNFIGCVCCEESYKEGGKLYTLEISMGMDGVTYSTNTHLYTMEGLNKRICGGVVLGW